MAKKPNGFKAFDNLMRKLVKVPPNELSPPPPKKKPPAKRRKK